MIAENLLKLRKHLSLSKDAFSLKLGITTRSYVNYERGDRKPPYELLIKLSDDFNVNLNWLINDKGEMFNLNESQFEKEKELFTKRVKDILKEEGLI